MNEEAKVLQEKLEYYTNFLAKHKSRVPSTSDVSTQRTITTNNKANTFHKKFPNSSFKYTKFQVPHSKNTDQVMKAHSSRSLIDSSYIVKMSRKLPSPSQKFVSQAKCKSEVFQNCANKGTCLLKEEISVNKIASPLTQTRPQKISNAPTCSKYTDVGSNTQQLLREMDDVIKRLKQKSNPDITFRPSDVTKKNHLNSQNRNFSTSTPLDKKFHRSLQTKLLVNKYSIVPKNRSNLRNIGKSRRTPSQHERTVLNSKLLSSGSKQLTPQRYSSPNSNKSAVSPFSFDSSKSQNTAAPSHTFLKVNEIKPVVPSIGPMSKYKLSAAIPLKKLEPTVGVSILNHNSVTSMGIPTLCGDKKSVFPIDSRKISNNTYSSKLLPMKDKSESQKALHTRINQVPVPATLRTLKLRKIQQGMNKSPISISLLSNTKKDAYRLHSKVNVRKFDRKLKVIQQSKRKQSSFVNKIANTKFKVVNERPVMSLPISQKTSPEKMFSKFKLSNKGTATANRSKNVSILSTSTTKSDAKPTEKVLSNAITVKPSKAFQSPNRVYKIGNKISSTIGKSEATLLKKCVVKICESQMRTVVSPQNSGFPNIYAYKKNSNKNRACGKIAKNIVNSKFKVVNKRTSASLQTRRKSITGKCLSKINISKEETDTANGNKSASISSVPVTKSDKCTQAASNVIPNSINSKHNQKFKSPNNVYKIRNKRPSISGNVCKARKRSAISPKNHRFSNIYAFKKNSSQNIVYGKQNCFNKIIISPITKTSTLHPKNTKLSYMEINNKLAGPQFTKSSTKMLPKKIKSPYKIINKNEKKSPIIISQSFILHDMDTEDPDISKEFDCIKRDILEKNKKNSKPQFLNEVYTSSTTLANKNESAQLRSARMIKSKYSVLNKKWTRPYYALLQKKSIRTPSKSYAIHKKQAGHVFTRARKQSYTKNIKRQYKLVNKGHTIPKKSPIIVSKSFILHHMDTEDPDISKEFDEIKRDIFEKNMAINEIQLSKRIYKSKTALVNKNVMSARMRSANMIKSKYSTLNKRYKTNYTSTGKYATRPAHMKGHPHRRSPCFRKMFKRNLSLRRITNVSPKCGRHYNHFRTRHGSMKKSTTRMKNRQWVKPVTNRLASQVLHRSINKVLSSSMRKKMSKVNMHCLFYNRFGRCNKGPECRYVHDPSKIAVCTRFLRGTCKNKDCLFSHEKCPGKMAICYYFLMDRCTKLDCPYRHEYLTPHTDLCTKFMKGYCEEGKECQKAHVLVCPYYAQGACEKGEKCLFPHPPRRRKRNIIVSDKLPDKKKRKKEADDPTEVDERYFEQKQCEEVQDSVIPSRTAISEQPSFIALSMNNSEMEM